MEVQSQEIKQLNITAVFEKIDHSSVTAEALRKALELSEQEAARSPFMDLPGLKSLANLDSRKDVSLEANRLRANDKSGKEPSDSDLIKYFQRVFELADKTNLVAYGFNYDMLVKVDEPVDYKTFVSPKILSVLGVEAPLGAGTRIIYEKDGKRIDFQTAPVSDPQQMVIHFNVHYEASVIDFESLQDQFVKDYGEVERIIQELNRI